MRNQNDGQVVGIQVASMGYSASDSGPNHLTKYLSSPYGCSLFRFSKKKSVFDWVSKFSKKADSYAQGIRDHMSLAPKFSETLKGKLTVGARILRSGGIEKVFRKYFSVGKREKLLKACQCYLSTASGPIAGLLFISNEKVAFRSDRSLTLTCQNGDSIRVPYKVLLPLRSIKRVSPSENIDNPSQKYIQMVTVDDYEFWFMGFVNYQRTFKYLQHVI